MHHAPQYPLFPEGDTVTGSPAKIATAPDTKIAADLVDSEPARCRECGALLENRSRVECDGCYQESVWN